MAKKKQGLVRRIASATAHKVVSLANEYDSSAPAQEEKPKEPEEEYVLKPEDVYFKIGDSVYGTTAATRDVKIGYGMCIKGLVYTDESIEHINELEGSQILNDLKSSVMYNFVENILRHKFSGDKLDPTGRVRAFQLLTYGTKVETPCKDSKLVDFYKNQLKKKKDTGLVIIDERTVYMDLLRKTYRDGYVELARDRLTEMLKDTDLLDNEASVDEAVAMVYSGLDDSQKQKLAKGFKESGKGQITEITHAIARLFYIDPTKESKPTKEIESRIKSNLVNEMIRSSVQPTFNVKDRLLALASLFKQEEDKAEIDAKTLKRFTSEKEYHIFGNEEHFDAPTLEEMSNEINTHVNLKMMPVARQIALQQQELKQKLLSYSGKSDEQLGDQERKEKQRLDDEAKKLNEQLEFEKEAYIKTHLARLQTFINAEETVEVKDKVEKGRAESAMGFKDTKSKLRRYSGRAGLVTTLILLGASAWYSKTGLELNETKYMKGLGRASPTEIAWAMFSDPELPDTINQYLLLQVSGATEAIASKVDGVTTTIGDKVDGATITIGEKVEGVTTTIGEKVEGVTTTIGEKVEGVTTTIGDKVDGVTTTIGEKVDGVTTTIGSKVDTAVSGVATSIGEKVDGAVSGVATTIGDKVDEYAGSVESIQDNIEAEIQAQMKTVVDRISALESKAQLTPAEKSELEMLKQNVGGLVNTVNYLRDKLRQVRKANSR